MHHWVKYCANRSMKSEVITLTSFVTNERTPSISMPPPPPNGFAMAGHKYICGQLPTIGIYMYMEILTIYQKLSTNFCIWHTLLESQLHHLQGFNSLISQLKVNLLKSESVSEG